MEVYQATKDFIDSVSKRRVYVGSPFRPHNEEQEAFLLKVGFIKSEEKKVEKRRVKKKKK